MSFEANQIREEVAPAQSIADVMENVWKFAKESLAVAQQKQADQANRHRAPVDIEVGDLVWLNMKNIKTERSSKKLDSKSEGPFKVIQQINPVAFKLELPATMKTHPVFHASLLSKAAQDPLPGQLPPPAQPIIVDNEEEWVVKQIIDIKKKQGGAIKARAEWENWAETDLTWYPIKNFDNAPRKLQDYFDAHPEKKQLRPTWLDQALIEDDEMEN